MAKEATEIRLTELGLDLNDGATRKENEMTSENVRIFFNNA